MINAFANLGPLAKRAGLSEATMAAADQAMVDQVYRPKAFKQLAQMGLLAAGAGAGYAGLKGLLNTAKRTVDPYKQRYSSSVITPIPMPYGDDEKSAGFSDAAGRLSSLAGKYIPGFNPDPANVSGSTSFPGFLPAALGLTAAGGLGGYAAVNGLLEHQRKAQKDDDLLEAKQDFEQAIASNYAAPGGAAASRSRGPKLASAAAADPAAELSRELDALFEKYADTWADRGNQGLGLYGAYALATAAPAALWAYNRAEAGSQRKVLDNALKLRARRSAFMRPQEIYAVPKPVRAQDPGDDAAVLTPPAE